MKPIFIVFCEGETEEAYVEMLRQYYRLPIQIRTKVTGNQISSKLIQRHMKHESISPRDSVSAFLLYDLDVEDVAKKLRACNAVLLGSNPCIEFWFILHVAERKAFVNTEECHRLLKQSLPQWANFQKGQLTDAQKEILWNNNTQASKRARALDSNRNPSSTVYLLLDELNKHRSLT